MPGLKVNALSQRVRRYLESMGISTKKVSLGLEGRDGNAFSLLAAFRARARVEGWTKNEIELVMADAMSGDYPHLLSVLARHCRRTAG